MRVKVLILLTLLASSVAQAVPAELAFNCGPKTDYLVGFFNGVGNTPLMAKLSREELQRVIGSSRSGVEIHYASFYNYTQGLAADLVETFLQRGQELDPSGRLANRFDLLSSLLQGNTQEWLVLEAVLPQLTAFRLELQSLHTKGLRDALVAQAQATSSADYARHNALLDYYVNHGIKMLLVAHSQGNLFLNHAYDYVAAKASALSVAVVHYAPASSMLRGDYWRADIDKVIGALDYSGRVPATNLLLISPTEGDWLGHGFIETYMRRSPVQTNSKLFSALDALRNTWTPERDNLFEIELTYSGTDYLGAYLDVVEPDSTRVGYGFDEHPFGTTGQIVTERRNGVFKSKYEARCSGVSLTYDKKAVTLLGSYQVRFANNKEIQGLPVTIQFKALNLNTGDLATLASITSSLGPRNLPPTPPEGQFQSFPVHAMTVDVSQSEDGNFHLAVH